jgi:hypothetical protein
VLTYLINRLLFGRPIYVWKAWISNPPGSFTLGFTEHSMGDPIHNNKGWNDFKPETFPLDFLTRDDGQPRSEYWCKVHVPTMLEAVRRDGFYIAPSELPSLARFVTHAFAPTQQKRTFVVTRVAYSYDSDPLKLPRTIDGEPT